jgi:hypothetical protein
MEKNNMAINFLFVSAVKKLYPTTMRSDMKEKAMGEITIYFFFPLFLPIFFMNYGSS